MTLLETQGSARTWGGECFALAKNSDKAGTEHRLAATSQGALPGGGSGAARRTGQRGVCDD